MLLYRRTYMYHLWFLDDLIRLIWSGRLLRDILMDRKGVVKKV